MSYFGDVIGVIAGVVIVLAVVLWIVALAGVITELLGGTTRAAVIEDRGNGAYTIVVTCPECGKQHSVDMSGVLTKKTVWYWEGEE